MPLLYGFNEELDDVLELLSEEALDELSELLSVPPTEVSAEVLPETSALEELEELDELDELEELVLVESELSDKSDPLPELLQPLSRAVIIKAARITDSRFFMSSPLLRYPHP